MRPTILDRVVCGRQRLAQDLASEDLGTADVATLAAKYIVFDTLEFEQVQEVVEYRVHGLGVAWRGIDCGGQRLSQTPRRRRP